MERVNKNLWRACLQLWRGKSEIQRTFPNTPQTFFFLKVCKSRGRSGVLRKHLQNVGVLFTYFHENFFLFITSRGFLSNTFIFLHQRAVKKADCKNYIVTTTTLPGRKTTYPQVFFVEAHARGPGGYLCFCHRSSHTRILR